MRYDEKVNENVFPISYFGLKGTPLENLKRSFGDTPQMVEWYQNKVGNKLPWKKYFQIVAPTHGGKYPFISFISFISFIYLQIFF